MDTNWAKAADESTLVAKRRMVVRVDGRQIALFMTPTGIAACNNRCPHEGFPLVEGTLSERHEASPCLLTCNWHNWKFDLADGRNLYGGERLRMYRVEVRDGQVWVDITDPPLEERKAALLRALHDAFDDNDYQRLARELARLKLLGADPLDAVRAMIQWSHDRMEFGWTHAFGGMADWLDMFEESGSDEQAALGCLLECIGHAADDTLREAVYPYAQQSCPYDEDTFVAALEAQDEPTALAHVRGCLEAGLDFDVLERGLARAALAHYADFGHSAIYVTKARALLARLGPDAASPLLASLVRQLGFATREDLIPQFRHYAAALTAFGTNGKSEECPSPHSWRRLGINAALEKTVLLSGHEPHELFNALLGANAWSMLAFDANRQTHIKVQIDDNVNWLSFTHALTFACAVRELCARYPELWPSALLQLSCFVGRNMRYTLDASQVPTEAWAVADADEFFTRELAAVRNHNADEFIVSVHRVKTLLAARTLIERGLPTPLRETVLSAVNRYLNSPIRRKQVQRTAYQAIKFVGKDG
jgi:nitrite reductase/ring-hydroxylating ferredoxin subunit